MHLDSSSGEQQVTAHEHGAAESGSLANQAWELCKENKVATAAVGLAAIGLGIGGVYVGLEESAISKLTAELSELSPIPRSAVSESYKSYWKAYTEGMKLTTTFFDRTKALDESIAGSRLGISPEYFQNNIQKPFDAAMAAFDKVTVATPSMKTHIATVPEELRRDELFRVQTAVLGPWHWTINDSRLEMIKALRSAGYHVSESASTAVAAAG